jgi:hypothetical protein
MAWWKKILQGADVATETASKLGIPVAAPINAGVKLGEEIAGVSTNTHTPSFAVPSDYPSLVLRVSNLESLVVRQMQRIDVLETLIEARSRALATVPPQSLSK